MIGRRKDREFDDYNFDDKHLKRAGKKHQGMKIINRFNEEDYFSHDVDDELSDYDETVKTFKTKQRKH